VLETVTCSTWGCNSLGYFGWWFSHLPANSGCGTDNVANDWWVYFAYPELALDPVQGCSVIYPNHMYMPVIKR
jgi:hypothetical protein